MTSRSGGAPRARSLALVLLGLDAHLVHIEAECSIGPAEFQLLGLAERTARELIRVRVRAALQGLGVDLFTKAITLRFEPAGLLCGGLVDLAVALAVLAAVGNVQAASFARIALLGELSLDGTLRPIQGVLPLLQGAVKHGIPRVVVPRANAREAAHLTGSLEIGVADSLRDVVEHIRTGKRLEGPGEPPTWTPRGSPDDVDLAEVPALPSARRALEIAAAGGHNLLFMGSPLSGKHLLARCFGSILPPLTHEEALEVTALHSVAGLLAADSPFPPLRPYRAPRHTVSAAGLLGGGDPRKPGEISLAHHGVLFFAELPEFRRNVLEAMWTFLDAGRVPGRRRSTFPAKAMLLGALTPCACGYAGERFPRCTCVPQSVQAYLARMDDSVGSRFDVQIALAPVDVALQGAVNGEPSYAVRRRVIAARAMQTRIKLRTNAQLSVQELERVALPDEAGAHLLAQAAERPGFTAADYLRVLRVARTLADLEGSDAVRTPHIAEAVVVSRLPPPGAT